MLKHLIKELKETQDELETHLLKAEYPILKRAEIVGKAIDEDDLLIVEGEGQAVEVVRPTFHTELFVRAQMVSEEIGKLINILEKTKKAYKPGRPKKIRNKFVRQIGLSFWEHLGKPKYHSTPFRHIVGIAFRATGIEGPEEAGDHSRIIKQVLKEYPFHDPSDNF